MAQAPLPRFAVDLLYNSLHNKSTKVEGMECGPILANNVDIGTRGCEQLAHNYATGNRSCDLLAARS